MSGTRLRRSTSLALAAAIASPPFLAGCAALASRDAPATSPVVHRAAPAQLAIAQMRHRSEARFELCPLDACPKPTPKTPASRSQALAAPLPLAVSPSPAPSRVSSSSSAQTTPASPTPEVDHETTTPARPTAVRTIVITFASGSALLTTAARQHLKAIISDAQRTRAIEIRGRTDELGSTALNDVLARSRALAVRDYLRAQHLPEDTTIRLSFKGACCYVAGNDTAEGRAANRRVEIEWQRGVQIAQGTTHEQH